MITNDGRGIILDPCLFCDRITIGPLFHPGQQRSWKEGERDLRGFRPRL
jgi:hypothetical protein